MVRCGVSSAPPLLPPTPVLPLAVRTGSNLTGVAGDSHGDGRTGTGGGYRHVAGAAHGRGADTGPDRGAPSTGRSAVRDTLSVWPDVAPRPAWPLFWPAPCRQTGASVPVPASGVGWFADPSRWPARRYEGSQSESVLTSAMKAATLSALGEAHKPAAGLKPTGLTGQVTDERLLCCLLLLPATADSTSEPCHGYGCVWRPSVIHKGDPSWIVI